MKEKRKASYTSGGYVIYVTAGTSDFTGTFYVDAAIDAVPVGKGKTDPEARIACASAVVREVFTGLPPLQGASVLMDLLALPAVHLAARRAIEALGRVYDIQAIEGNVDIASKKEVPGEAARLIEALAFIVALPEERTG